MAVCSQPGLRPLEYKAHCPGSLETEPRGALPSFWGDRHGEERRGRGEAGAAKAAALRALNIDAV